MFSMKSVAPEQFIDGGLARIPAGTAFMYLFRRYGYPDFYSYKAIAEYAVETCRETAVLRPAPNFPPKMGRKRPSGDAAAALFCGWRCLGNGRFRLVNLSAKLVKLHLIY